MEYQGSQIEVDSMLWEGIALPSSDGHNQTLLDPVLVALSLPDKDIIVPPAPTNATKAPNQDPSDVEGLSRADTAVFAIPSLPLTCSEYVGSEATIPPSHRSRLHSPCVSDQSSNLSVNSEWSDAQAMTWSSPEMHDIITYTAGANLSDSEWLFDTSYLDILSNHALEPPSASTEPSPNLDLYSVDSTITLIGPQSQQFGSLTTRGHGQRNSQTLKNISYARDHDSSQPYPVIKRRRTQTRRKSISPRPAIVKLNRRKQGNGRSPSHDGDSNTSAQEHATCGSLRSFVCTFAPYGCRSTFATKNEWKRHTLTQHMRMGFWRCDQCPQAKHRPNDFNRKDLFVQHVRRMHPDSYAFRTPATTRPINSVLRNDYEEQALAMIAQRCYLQLRTPPTRCSCLFCDLDFEGPHAWDERIEHIGRHLETSKKRGEEPCTVDDWRPDMDLEQWLACERIIEWHEGEWNFSQDRQI